MGFGAIFDWDGVIIDSSKAHEKSWEMLAAEENRTLPPEHFKRGFGRKNHAVISKILQWTGDAGEIRRLGDRKETLYREIIKKEGIAPLPGVRKLLEDLKGAGIPCAIGSSTPRINVDAVLNELGLEDYFQAIVCAEDVSRSKPDPEVFLKAARRLNVPPERCVVFEDATFGVEAALAAGMKAAAVATTHPPEKLAQAHLVALSTENISLPELRGLFAGAADVSA